MYSKNLVNSNFDEAIDETEKEFEVSNKRDQINKKEDKNTTDENKDDELIMKMRMMSFYH